MRNLIVIALIVIVISVVSVMPVNTVEVVTDLRVIKPLPADWNPYQRLYDELLKPTVRINTKDGIGSGVVISIEQGAKSEDDSKLNAQPSTLYVLTAAHVVDKESTVTVTFYSYTKGKQDILCELSAFVVLTDTNKDLALLRLKPNIQNTGRQTLVWSAKLAPKDYTPFIFAPIITVGCSLGLPPRPSEGIITAINEYHWEVSSPILPGNSGGPVYDANTHKVIGIAVWVKTYYGQLITTMAGIVPIPTIYDFLDTFYHKDTKGSWCPSCPCGKTYQLCRSGDVSPELRISGGARPADSKPFLVNGAPVKGNLIQFAKKGDKVMSIVSQARFMATIQVDAANRIIEKWARTLKEEAPDMYAKLMARIPDKQHFAERLAQPANDRYKGFVNPAFVSKSGQGSSEIETAQGSNLKRAYDKFLTKVRYIYETVDGVVAKRFKDLVDLMKPLFGTGTSERLLPFTGTKVEGRSCVPIAVHWLVKDKRVLDWLRAGDNVMAGGPFLVTPANQISELKAALTGRLIQAGAAIVKANFDAAVMADHNARTNHLIQGMVNPGLGLTPFATGGLSHVDYIMDHEQLFLEVQIDQI